MSGNNSEKEVKVPNEKRQQEVCQYITEIRNGNKDAFNKLYSCTETYVYYCVVKYGVPEDSVIDVMQEIYTAIYQNLDTLREVNAALGWIKSIAFHKCMDYFRRNRKELSIEDGGSVLENSEIIDSMEFPEDIVENKETQRIIGNLIDELPIDYRQIIVAYYFNECNIDEIAETLGIPEGTVKTKLYRARKQLQKSIEKLEREQGIRLHSVSAAPIFMLLFHLEAEATAIPAGISKALSVALKAFLEQLPEAAGSQATLHASEYIGKSMAMGSKLAGATVKKFVIGIVAVLLGVGCILFFIQNKDEKGNGEVTDEAVIDTEETYVQSDESVEHPQTEELQEVPEQAVDSERQTKIRQYYHDMFDTICETHQWPDGTDLCISGDITKSLQYIVLDFDGDGYEEFAISVITADYMAAYREDIYKYNPDTEQCTCILTVYPGAEYYDNGIAFGALDNSHRFGKDLFQYDTVSGIFVRQAYIFLWNRIEYENYNGHPFPENEDSDGDGAVWCFIDTDENYSYMNQDEYDEWCQSRIYSAQKIEIHWFLFSDGWQYE